MNSALPTKLSFSGHDSFHCRQLWLKKGYDFIKKGKKFSDEDAVVSLGVGKNMVSAIYFWMKAFGLIDKNGLLTEIAIYLLDDDGKDPYLEDEATLWILHYQLVSQGIASTYCLVFNLLRKEKIEFTKENFFAFVFRKAEEMGITSINKNTLASDFEVFIKTYLRTDSQSKDKEDTFSGLLTDLNLVVRDEKKQVDTKSSRTYYSIPNEFRSNIPVEIILYVVLDDETIDTSFSMKSLVENNNQVGSVFALQKDALQNIVEAIAQKDYWVFNDHAGIKEIQFKNKLDKFWALDQYYGN